MSRKILGYISMLGLSVAVGGCEQSMDNSSLAPQESITCELGCTERDPNPTAPGVFLTSAVTPAMCFTGEYTDTDQDGVGDRCENDIGRAFAPVFRYNDADNVGRESYWAANRVPGTNFVRVIYLLGYYFDLGVQEGYTSCKFSSVGEILAECDGHHGDSEHIISTISYDSTLKHWVAYSLKLSHHGGYITANPGPKGGYPSGFAWSRIGASPIIWVANGKHANYPSQKACNDGNGGGHLVDLVFSYDTCNGNNSFFYLDNWANRNIGSSQRKLIDCVLSLNQFYQDPPHPQECFWTASRFTGWQLDQTTWADGYRTPLQDFGY